MRCPENPDERSLALSYWLASQREPPSLASTASPPQGPCSSSSFRHSQSLHLSVRRQQQLDDHTTNQHQSAGRLSPPVLKTTRQTPDATTNPTPGNQGSLSLRARARKLKIGSRDRQTRKRTNKRTNLLSETKTFVWRVDSAVHAPQADIASRISFLVLLADSEQAPSLAHSLILDSNQQPQWSTGQPHTFLPTKTHTRTRKHERTSILLPTDPFANFRPPQRRRERDDTHTRFSTRHTLKTHGPPTRRQV